MIEQAKNTGIIKINSQNKTYRNYINVPDLLEISNCFLKDDTSEKSYTFDTFGQTLEMQDLANLIFEILNIKSNIDRTFNANLPSDNYFGNPEEQNILLERYNLRLNSVKTCLETIV
ncbi:hypothetical protein [Candidatus Deianiraea vastatrix]|uniref:Uncharacterized protein n=1 Tax=Candidatus Deianiraea vastatrix TaxID=2163644 RepID=A0A5B8XG72_9RICK|nr:hypothetical protein [Candidatus Deianiraea vastatrix]QED23886.1 hypothetical protein Deia_01105 [Candidatus Deianiraea vastatrix]